MKTTYLDRSSIHLSPYIPQKNDDIVICRCEEITRGDIRRAIHEGMYTMTEIKRFLRVGMGLCQGQTCTKLIKGILQAELSCQVKPDEEPTARAPMRPVYMIIYGKELGK